MKKLKPLFAPIILAIALSCNGLYKAGNLIVLDYPIQTPIRTDIIQKYVDTLILQHGYSVPPKWQSFDKLVDLDSINHKRIYFHKDPEEMYLISYGGMLVLNDVYNPKINENDWVSERKNLSQDEEERVKKRFKNEILDRIELMAKQAGLPDSLIYKR